MMKKTPNKYFLRRPSDMLTEAPNSNDVVLPPLVLSLLLKYLPLEERNCVRLTCKLWNDVCNCDLRICRNEKLVFWPTDDIEDVKKCLEQTTKEILNLVFHVNELCEIPEQTWMVCGRKICSILWYDESGHDKALETTVWNIVRYCSRLECLSRVREYDSNDPENLISENVLCKMAEKNVVCCNLRAVSDSFDLAEPTISRVFQVFPNISNLRIRRIGKSDNINALSKIPETVKKLYLDVASSLKSLNSNIELKELFSPFDGVKKDINQELFPFFAHQSELESIRLVIMMDPGICSVKELELLKAKLIAHILKSCYRLKELNINFWSSNALDTDEETCLLVNADKTIIEKISRLNSFHVSGFDYAPLLTPSATSTVLTVINLKSVKLPRARVSCNWLIRCPIFCNLQCLELPTCDLVTLQTISKVQVNLRTLVINELSVDASFPDFVTDVHWELIEKLKQLPNVSFLRLQHLNIYGGVYALLLIFSNFHFPVLKHFNFSHYLTPSGKEDFLAVISLLTGAINCLPQRIPTIEILQLDLLPIYWTKCYTPALATAHILPFLEILVFHSAVLEKEINVFDTYNMTEFFRRSSKLRVLIEFGVVTFYNRGSEEMRYRLIREIKSSKFNDIHSIFKKSSCCKLISSNSWRF